MKKKRKLKKFWVFTFIFLIIGCCAFFGLNYYKNVENDKKDEQRIKIVNDIKGHYNKIVKIKDGASLYKKVDNKYTLVSNVFGDETFTLKESNIDTDTKYFEIDGMDLFVKYKDVEPADSLIVRDQRYKNYLVFNENVVTKDEVNLYRDDKLAYKLFYSLDVPIIEKNSNGYYIEYNAEEVFIKSEDVVRTYEHGNTDLVEASSVPVTVYHFIYLDGDTSCNEDICHSEGQIKEEFNYLKENGYFTLNTTELGKFIDGNIRLPDKSILITIDDGSRAWNFIPIIEEYKINVTLFLITGWYELEKFNSPYMEVASHTHNLHNGGVCPSGRGSAITCLEKGALVEDLRTSRDILGGTKAFCYPFYQYNDYAIEALKEAGFEMAFTGGGVRVTHNVDKFKIPRIPILGYTTLEQYVGKIS